MLRSACRALAALLLLSSAGVHAQDAERWPTRPIRMIVPFAPGGTTDIIARIIAPRMAEGLGQPVVVENRPGAGGNVGAEQVARAAPDGYTMLLGTPGPLATNVSLMKQMPYDPAKDFTAIGQVVSVQSVVVVNAQQPFQTLADLVAYAKRNPGKLTYGSGGAGSSPHLAGELLKAQAGIFMVHLPYRGDALAVNDLLGGQISAMVANIAGVLPHVKSGKLRALAVAGPKRSPLLPEVPTVSESGLPNYSVTGWAGLVAPAGTPAPIVAKLNAELNRVLNSPDVAERIAQQAAEPAPGSAAAFDSFIRSELSRWAEVIKRSRITLD
ncbi:MAG: tripartite tricarboxylate transporter substrate binding protein [Burkholderiales bacterium]|nr:tripartite tricarboxylate transporter substrate binding protein [Burkholderiales bacterium]